MQLWILHWPHLSSGSQGHQLKPSSTFCSSSVGFCIAASPRGNWHKQRPSFTCCRISRVIYSVTGHTLARTGTDRAMAGTDSRQPRIVEARVPSQTSPCGFCGEQSGTGTAFSPNTFIFFFCPVVLISPTPMIYNLISSYRIL
jgi:hypothetical protein